MATQSFEGCSFDVLVGHCFHHNYGQNEENVWHLCKTIEDRHGDKVNQCYCVFISNSDRTIPLWCQRASKRPDGLVIWVCIFDPLSRKTCLNDVILGFWFDYHVIFIHKMETDSLVYDLDTLLEFPCPFAAYIEKGIHACQTLKPQFHRYFRVIPCDVYLSTFASDRSHMLNDNGEWLKPPPSYPCIQTQENSNNIQDFINMDASVGVGNVMKYDEFCDFFTAR